MAYESRSIPSKRNPGGSYDPPEELQAAPPKFVLKEKVVEMIAYALPVVNQFGRRHRKIADTLKDSMMETLHLAVRLEKKYYKKTTMEEMDIELQVLRDFIVIASDARLYPKGPPPLTLHQREVWSRYNDVIGRLIGGYRKSLK